MNTTETYGIVARFFHWVIGIMMIGVLAVGLIMKDMPNSPEKFELYGLHKATGMLIIAFVALRILWRMKNLTPAFPATLSPLQKIGSNAAHIFLYIAMVIMPLSGWGMSSAGGYKISFFGLFDVPPIVPKSQMLGGIFHETHELLSKALIAVLVVHVLAAFLHHFWYKDNVLKRMTWGK